MRSTAKAQVEKRARTPADRMRQAVGEEWGRKLRAVLHEAVSDPDTRAWAYRAFLREEGASLGERIGVGRVAGMQAGALAMINPGFEAEDGPLAAAEAMFRKGDHDVG